MAGSRCTWDYVGHDHAGTVGLISSREDSEYDAGVEIIEQVCAAGAQVIRERSNREYSTEYDVRVVPAGSHTIRCGEHRHLNAADVRACQANIEYWRAEQAAEIWAENAIERYLEGGWDVTGAYSLDS